MKVCPKCGRTSQVTIQSYPTVRYERVTLNELYEDGYVDYDSEEDEIVYDNNNDSEYFCPECQYNYEVATIEDVWKKMVEEK